MWSVWSQMWGMLRTSIVPSKRPVHNTTQRMLWGGTCVRRNRQPMIQFSHQLRSCIANLLKTVISSNQAGQLESPPKMHNSFHYMCTQLQEKRDYAYSEHRHTVCMYVCEECVCVIRVQRDIEPQNPQIHGLLASISTHPP